MTKQEHVMKLIENGVRTLGEITDALAELNLLKQTGPFSFIRSKRYREVDRTLQRLRIAGKIQYDTKLGWSVKPDQAETEFLERGKDFTGCDV